MNLNPQPRYPLQSVVNGRSETVVDVPLSTLLGGQFAINVHKSQKHIRRYVACGELRAQLAPATGRGLAIPSWLLVMVAATGLALLSRGLTLHDTSGSWSVG